MGKVLDIRELRGETTPESCISNVLENVDDVDKVVVIIKRKNAQMIYGCSDMNMLNALGMCEVGKQLILSDMWEEEE